VLAAVYTPRVRARGRPIFNFYQIIDGLSVLLRSISARSWQIVDGV